MRYMYVTQNGFIDPPPQIAFNMDQIFILDHFLKNKELIFPNGRAIKDGQIYRLGPRAKSRTPILKKQRPNF